MMQRIVFASDLDNTLLFSRKHAVETDLCVEILDGMPQGYLTKDTPRYLEQIMRHALFVPVTSRSVEQYRRIQFPDVCRPQYAVTTNGAILLIDGEIDRQWYQESWKAVLPWKDELGQMLQVLGRQPLASRCRLVDEMFVFAACDTPQDAMELYTLLQGTTPLAIEVTGRKVYFFPPPVNKGTAISQLRHRFQADRIICAGDSSMDVPMLRQSDISIVPDQGLMEGLPCVKQVVWNTPERFYDFVLRETIRYIG